MFASGVMQGVVDLFIAFGVLVTVVVILVIVVIIRTCNGGGYERGGK